MTTVVQTRTGMVKSSCLINKVNPRASCDRILFTLQVQLHHGVLLLRILRWRPAATPWSFTGLRLPMSRHLYGA